MGWNPLGSLVGGIGGFATGGPVGALTGLFGGGSDGNPNRSSAGMTMRNWDPDEEEWLKRAYADAEANRGFTGAERDQFITGATADYFNPMSREINSTMSRALGRSAVNNARSGMAGSSQALFGDAAVGRQAAGLMSDAAARSRNMGIGDFMNFDANRRANVGSAQSQVSGLWQNRMAGSDRWSESPTASMGTGLSMLGMGIGMGSPYLGKANSWLGGLFGGGGKSGGPAAPGTGGYGGSGSVFSGSAPSNNADWLRASGKGSW